MQYSEHPEPNDAAGRNRSWFRTGMRWLGLAVAAGIGARLGSQVVLCTDPAGCRRCPVMAVCGARKPGAPPPPESPLPDDGQVRETRDGRR